MAYRTLTAKECSDAMNTGEFTLALSSSSPRTAVILTQSWYPQWTSMRAYAKDMAEGGEADVLYVEYDREPWFEEFMAFKEYRLGNRTIPYVRFYADGKLTAESNFIGKDRFRSLLFAE